MGTVIKNMTGVSILSEYFATPSILDFFPNDVKAPKNNRVALVYGSNGSGKSTIANGFRAFKSCTEPNNTALDFIEENVKATLNKEWDRQNIFIFDEEYISSRVQIKESGLEAIVLFGEQIDIEEKINIIKKQINIESDELIRLESEYGKYKDRYNILSSNYWYNLIAKDLREGGWAEKGSKIKQQKHNLSVNLDEVIRLGSLSVKDICLEDLKKKFEEGYNKYILIDIDSKPINEKIKKIDLNMSNTNSVKLLLQKIVDKPELTKREEKILDLFGMENVISVREKIEDRTNIICERCFQPIEEDYRISVLEEIESILNQEVEKFIEELKKLLIEEIQNNAYRMYKKLPSYEKVLKYIDKFNESVKKHNSMIQEKIENPFKKLNIKPSINLTKSYDELNQVLKDLDNDRINHNRIINERNNVMNELLKLNDSIAHFEIKDMFDSFKKQSKEIKDIEKQVNKKKDMIEEFDEEILKLDMKRKNFQIASKEINKSLKYVFYSDKRISIELGTDQLYRVKVKGEFVKPSKISCGERNVLALCYYFTEIAKNMEEKSIYSNEVLLVIDDPISSFDVENKVGILSFLRLKLEQVLKGCITSKIIIMTHDIGVIFDLQKVMDEISKFCGRTSSNAEYKLFQLENKNLSEFRYSKHNEYTQLLKKMYQYAKNPNTEDDLDLFIGNIMRRVLEAFSTFNFKLGIQDIVLDDEVLKLLPNDQSREYYKNRMYRLILNNESHFKDNIRGIPENSFFSLFSTVEKQQTAKDVLSYIYCINKSHIVSHLPEAEADLKSWCPR